MPTALIDSLIIQGRATVCGEASPPTVTARATPVVVPVVEPMPRDKYDEAVDWLVRRPSRILPAFSRNELKGGCLFQFMDNARGHVDGIPTGCPILVKEGKFTTPSADINRRIKRSRLLPADLNKLLAMRGPRLRRTLEFLGAIQRIADRVLRSPAIAQTAAGEGG